MESHQKDLCFKRGLLLGILFSVFPILDLFFGKDMSLTQYYTIFFILWFILYSVFMFFIGKEFRDSFLVSDFKGIFRILFIVSALSLSIVTITKISLWNVFYTGKYIELNESRDIKLIGFLSEFTKETLDDSYAQGSFTDDEYEESLTSLEDQLEFVNSSVVDKWTFIKENGVSKTLFIGSLVYNLFFVAIYNAIFAFFLRRNKTI